MALLVTLISPMAHPNPAFRHSRTWKHFVAQVGTEHAEGAGALFSAAQVISDCLGGEEAGSSEPGVAQENKYTYICMKQLWLKLNALKDTGLQSVPK